MSSASALPPARPSACVLGRLDHPHPQKPAHRRGINHLGAFGLELAELRGRADETNARLDLKALRDAGVISGELERRLQRLRELRRMLVHEYATASAEQVHESALIVAGSFPTFYEAYRAWIKRGFAPRR